MTQTKAEPLLELERVSRIYRLGRTIVPALEDVSFRLERGEYVVITGASGSGKSTMLHLLGLLDRPDSGELRYEGRLMREMSDRAVAAIRNREIGFVFQSFNLLREQTALRNVMLPLIYARGGEEDEGGRRGRAREALDRVGLGQRTDHRPFELSGGEQQRVAIARALVKRPSLILADEPTGNLDSRAGKAIMEILDGLAAEGITVAIITHDPGVAGHARRRVRLLDGRIVEDDGAARAAAPTD